MKDVTESSDRIKLTEPKPGEATNFSAASRRFLATGWSFLHDISFSILSEGNKNGLGNRDGEREYKVER